MDTYEQKISHLKALYHLAGADAAVNKVEMIYIRNVAKRLGVKVSELEKFDGTEPDLVLPDREYKLFSLFHRLAIIVMVDNPMNERERHYCANLGIKMGLHPNAINEILDVIAVRGAMNMMPSEIVAIFKKYSS